MGDLIKLEHPQN